MMQVALRAAEAAWAASGCGCTETRPLTRDLRTSPCHQATESRRTAERRKNAR